MELLTAIQQRHSVRSYLDKPIGKDVCDKLQGVIDECNAQSGLHIRLVTNEPKAFDSFMAHYGKFSGVKSYVALIGKKGEGTDEKIGYYGEKIVLAAQMMGLNTCWVAMTYKKVKSALNIAKDEKIYCVLALGYGATQGVKHKNKTLEEVCKYNVNPVPEWFMNGVNAALLAPTAMNQQKFCFSLLSGNKVEATTKSGFYSKIDLGIAKYHFEVGAGKDNFNWQ